MQCDMAHISCNGYTVPPHVAAGVEPDAVRQCNITVNWNHARGAREHGLVSSECGEPSVCRVLQRRLPLSARKKQRDTVHPQ
eukprot:349640-Chlamydomonas_euryale.AAC.2